METKQYRLMRVYGKPKKNGDLPTVGWNVCVTHGLMDVEFIDGGATWEKQADARKAAKDHAAARGVEPIIVT